MLTRQITILSNLKNATDSIVNLHSGFYTHLDRLGRNFKFFSDINNAFLQGSTEMKIRKLKDKEMLSKAATIAEDVKQLDKTINDILNNSREVLDYQSIVGKAIQNNASLQKHFKKILQVNLL